MFDFFIGIGVFNCKSKLNFFIHLVKPLGGMYRSFIWTLRRLRQYTFNPSL
jgi:hypothetical protein